MTTAFKNLASKKVIVTGGTGFIGAHLVERLLSLGADVTVLTRKKVLTNKKNLAYIQFDLSESTLSDFEAVAQKVGPTDCAVYAAASILPRSKGTENLLEAKKNNLDPYVLFLETFGKRTRKNVYTSTVDVYGRPEVEMYDEQHPIRPISTYGLNKYCGEKFLELWSLHEEVPYSMVRFSQVYGPNEPLVRVIPFAIDALKTGKSFTLVGGGKDKRRFLYVLDAVQAVILAMQVDTNNVCNIAGPDVISIAGMIETIESVYEKAIKTEVKPAVGKPNHNVPSISKAQQILGFEPQFSFEQGIALVKKESLERN